MDSTHELPADRQRKIERFVTDWLSEEGIPGAALAVVDGDETVYAQGFGARDLETNAPATPETRYGVASITKSFTAMAVLRLVEAGEVGLDEPVSSYVPFFDEASVSNEEAGPPTVAELLSHSSGMPSDGASVALISRLVGGDPEPVPLSSRADLERYVFHSLSERVSDDRFFYYNTGYTVLGALVEAVDGRAFRTYVGEELLEPLGMDRSVLAPPDFAGLENAMTPYREEDGERVETSFPVKGLGAAGGLVSTVADLGAYLEFQFDPDPAVLDPRLLTQARRAQTPRQEFLDGTGQGYGYGWMRRPFLGDDLIEHSGSLGVSTAYVGFLDDRQRGVALACNDSPSPSPKDVGPALLAITQGTEPAEATHFFGLRGAAEAVAGTYESYRGIQSATVERDGGGLEISFENVLEAETVMALPENADPTDHRYYHVDASGVRIPVTFEATDHGMDMFYRRWRLHRTCERV